jgi:hypothetical protein
MICKNLSKTFTYVNENGQSLVLDAEHGFIINKPAGIDTLAINHAQAQGINQVGSTIQSSNVQSRPVVVNGYIVGHSYVSSKDQLLSIIRPDLSAKLYADDYYLDVRPTATPVIGPESFFAPFQFSLIAAYPYWQKDSSASATLSGVRKSFKFPWNISRPYRFGEVITAAFINIYNEGQVPIPYTVTFSAIDTVVSPKLIEADTNEYLLLNKSLVAGEKVVVEITHERTYVNSSVDGECRGALDLGSSFFRLKVGDNVIKPEATSGKSNLNVKIDFAAEIVGIAL